MRKVFRKPKSSPWTGLNGQQPERLPRPLEQKNRVDAGMKRLLWLKCTFSLSSFRFIDERSWKFYE